MMTQTGSGNHRVSLRPWSLVFLGSHEWLYTRPSGGDVAEAGDQGQVMYHRGKDGVTRVAMNHPWFRVQGSGFRVHRQWIRNQM